MRRELLNLCVFRAWNIQPLEHEVFQKMFRYSVLKDYNFVLCFLQFCFMFRGPCKKVSVFPVHLGSFS